MDKLRLLLVDDDEDNRLILRAICKKLEGFEIRDATDGIEAVNVTESWRPHIILMDIMMPNMDGFEASKIIKERYPETVIMIVTARLDSGVEDKMNEIGLEIYINKPIDRELIRYKLKSIGSSLRLKYGNFKNLSRKIALNPFNSDIRAFKTIFDILDEEAMMDFGMWLFDQYNGKYTVSGSHLDKVIEIFYLLMSQGNKNGKTMSIIIEESNEEFYLSMKFDKLINFEENLLEKLNEFETKIIIQENIICVCLRKPFETKAIAIESEKNLQLEEKSNDEIKEENKQSTKEVKVIHSEEKELLKQSFVDKTAACDYVNDIGGDVLEEIRDLASLDEEWAVKLRTIEEEPTAELLKNFADTVLHIYVKVINNLFEFTALAYALSSLGTFIKDTADIVSEDREKVKMLVMLLEYLGTDLTSWREHVFILQDTADIHYLDSSFFSSCMQIEGIISNKDIGAHDDDNDMEFF